MRSFFKVLPSTLLLISFSTSTLSASVKSPFSSHHSSSSHPHAKLDSGLAIGREKDGIDSWRGIPYAQKPIKNLRLMAPVPAEALTGTQHFSQDPDACFNVNSTVSSPDNLNQSQREKLDGLLVEALSYPAGQVAAANNNNSTATQSEDCLYLNIHRPHGTHSHSGLPVLVWVYGGGFTASDLTQYRPEKLLKRSVELDQPIIYVHMNYRLGAYGWLGGSEVLKNSKANLGLRDQAMAIEWVHDNIANFGGDPSKVTIWGESAGSMSVGMHLVREGKISSRGRFRSAIMESGSPYHIPNGSTFDVGYTQMISSTGCDQSKNPFKCLQKIDVSSFNKAMNSVSPPGRGAFSPVVDNDFIPDFPDKLLAEGKYHKDVAIINGEQSDEGTALSLGTIRNVVEEQGFDGYLRSSIPGLNDSNYEKIKELYPSSAVAGSPYGTGTLYQITSQSKRIASLLGQFTFTYPRRLFLEKVSKTNPGVFSYVHAAFKDTPLLGSYHAIEMVNSFGWMNGTATTDEITARWIGFVNNQRPDAQGYSKFPIYNNVDKKLLWFGNETSWVEKDDFRQEQTDYLQKVIANRG